MKYSGNLKNDILAINKIDEFDYELIDYEMLSYRPDSAQFFDFLASHQSTIFYCDVDADGFSAAGVVIEYMPSAKILFGDRTTNRGLTVDMIKEMRSFYEFDSIVTLDCGISNTDAIEYAKEIGIDVFVTDHHLPGENLPSCLVINPHLEDIYFKHLCGAGVIYSIFSSLRGENTNALQYAAIGTICDVVPMTHDNRYIIKRGLSLMKSENVNPKIKLLIESLGINLANLTEKDIGWYLGPAINAASRLGKEHVAFSAYVNGNPEDAIALKGLNQERKKLTKKAAKNASIVNSDHVVVAVLNESNASITGLAAGNMSNKYKKPVCVCMKSGPTYTCSIRTMNVIDANDYINKSAYVTGGGHKAAAGFSVRAKNFDAFIVEISRYVQENGVFIETEIEPIEIDIKKAVRLFNEMRTLAPFGNGFSEPIFLQRNISLTEKSLGNTANGHLRIEIDGIVGYYYNQPTTSFVGTFDIRYSLSYNSWKHEAFFVVEKMSAAEGVAV